MTYITNPKAKIVLQQQEIDELKTKIANALAACDRAEAGYQGHQVGVWISTREIRAYLEPG